jgi:hypothetical protein
VRLEDVDPEEAFSPRLPPPPVERGGDRFDAAPLGDDESAGVRALAVPVVVDVEAPGEAPAGVEREGRDEGARGVALILQALRERPNAGAKRRAGVVAEAVLEREKAGQDVGVRGERDDVVRAGVREDTPFRSEAVEGGSLQPRVAREAGGVGAPRVDGDEDDVEACR